jgi:ABC-type sugar transport system substrate-binding protein
VRHATKRGVPVVVVNLGPTRADALPVRKVEHGTTPFLTALADRVGRG